MNKLYNCSKCRLDVMQKIFTALLLSITFCFATQAQNYKITFSGTGESTTVDSIRILNITQETSILLVGPETLNLVQNITGISDLVTNEKFITVYPNPMTQNANLSFITMQSSEVVVRIVDLAGKLIAINKQTLKAGKSIYRISGIKSGTYLIEIQLPNKECSTKLISTNGSNGIPEIQLLTTNIVTNLKSATIEDLVEMQYNEGDNLLFIGYSGDNLIDSVEIVLTADANIEFNFEPPSVDIHSLLAQSYEDFKSYLEYSFLFDAAYSNKINFPNDMTWGDITHHTQNSTDSKLSALWSDAYKIIYSVNSVIANAELISNEAEKQLIIAQAKCIRAYLYYTLVFWFGDIPIDVEVISDNIFPWFSVNNLPRSAVNDVYTQIITDLEHSINYLPQNIAQSENIKLNKYFAAGIKARTLIIQQKWDELKDVTSQIINSGQYTLSENADNFLSYSPENIFGFDEVNNYAFKHYYDWLYVPAMRYTEILLMNIEANYQKGETATAMNLLNRLLIRRNLTPLSEISLNDIYDQWKTELKIEGSTFNYFKRFNKIQEELALYQAYKFLLPIPQLVIELNPYALQNPGY
ncbi:MAG TPA: RagB/SusD family nutrient uptake outer membrane protein [Prolixibacteraceae bacterium]|nr:RagB/SusD family nutrient uptake outer membrane protein [Prolixibacteraceae bacterium]